MAKRNDVPKFGLLSGVKVVFSGYGVAGPSAGGFMAEMGADAIWIESARASDPLRMGTGMIIEAERRNQRTISLDIPSPKGKEIFLRLLAESDIFIEASKSGQFEKWGLSDEVLWEANPKLVIVHVSGFGATGLPEYVGRGSWDGIGQAFSGLMFANSKPGRTPEPAMFMISDYYTAFTAGMTALAAYVNVLRTGKGESIDVAQYEATLRCGSAVPLELFNKKRPFNHSSNGGDVAGYSAYECKDGNYVYLLCSGPGVMRAVIPLVGLEYGSAEYPEGISNLRQGPRFGNAAGDKFEAALKEYCNQRTAAEVDDTMSRLGIPVSRVLTYDDMLEHPQYKARETLTTWNTVSGEELIGYNLEPKMKKHPGRIWRGAPFVGMDNEDILSDLGYSEQEIAEFYENKVIVKKETLKRL